MRWFRASPLAGIEYDAATGAYDMHRFVESPVDARIEAFVATLREMKPKQVAATRSALRDDDLYTLKTFGRRCALASVSGRDRPSITDGVWANLLIAGDDRLDWRDRGVETELLAWAMTREGRDHQTELPAIAGELGLPLAGSVAGLVERGPDRVAPAQRLVRTPLGAGFADADGARYAPTVDLVGLAFAVQEVLESDVTG